MKIRIRFQPIGLYILTVLVALSFPLSVYAEEVSQPLASDSTVVQPTTTQTVENTPSPSSEPTETTVTSTSPAPAPVSSDVKSNDPATSTSTLPVVQTTNTENSTSKSGDASVTSNSTAGSALSGDATADTTVATIINSQTDLANAGTFTKDITGTVVGDMTLDSLIAHSLKNGTSVTTVSGQPIVISPVTQLGTNQSIAVAAISGDATVSDNGLAGDAITGNAIAHANSISVINSALLSQGAFIGTVNILGNLDGDIFISPDFLPSLVSASTLAGNAPSSLVRDASDVTVNNAVVLSATSGDVGVIDNSKAGNALSGDASTNLLAYALVGSQLTANRGLLVFVNVLGKWVGTIVSSPDGATTALLATDITHQGVVPYAINPNASTTVNNDIRVAALSGNALVARNTEAGNAQSGKAMASANVLTMINNSMDLSGWLGILFINVFGSWHGSFGIDTANGNLPGSPAPVAVPVIMTAAPSSPTFIPVATIRTPRHTSASAKPILSTLAAAHHDDDLGPLQAIDPMNVKPAVLGEATQLANTGSPSKYPFSTLLLCGVLVLGALLSTAKGLRHGLIG